MANDTKNKRQRRNDLLEANRQRELEPDEPLSMAGAARQGGNTILEGLTRYGKVAEYDGGEFVIPMERGDYVKFADVERLLANAGAPAKQLTDARIIELHDSMFPRVLFERDKIMGNVVKFARAIESEILSAHAVVETAEELKALQDENDKLREALGDSALASTMLHKLSVENGGINAVYSGGAAQILAEALGQQFTESGAENYLEVGFNTKTGVRLLVTLQRCDGKTPSQFRHEAEQKLAAVSAELKSLRAAPAVPAQPTQAEEAIEVRVDYADCSHIAPIKSVSRFSDRIAIVAQGLDTVTLAAREAEQVATPSGGEVISMIQRAMESAEVPSKHRANTIGFFCNEWNDFAAGSGVPPSGAEQVAAVRRAALEEAKAIASNERNEFSEKAAKNNGRESDFAFGSVNSAERIWKAIDAIASKEAAAVEVPMHMSDAEMDESHDLLDVAQQSTQSDKGGDDAEV